MRLQSLLSLVILCCGCVVSTTRRQPIKENDGLVQRKTGTAIRYEHANDAPEISRSTGAPGGVVVLWPRVVPRAKEEAMAELATRLQARLERIAGKVSKTVDRRPAPERVCPYPDGCRASSIGAVLAVNDKSCAIVAIVSPPGTKDQQLLPLAGEVKLDPPTVKFRDPPESSVKVSDFVPCDKLLADLDSNVTLPGEESVAKALEAAK